MANEVKATLRRPFDAQVAAFRLRMLDLAPTAVWTDVWQQGHDRSFMVAGAIKADLLADLAGAVEKAVRDGTTLETFEKDFRAIVAARNWHGWTGEGTARGEAWRIKTIYMTNMRASYAAGRWAQIVDGGFKYVIYRHGGSLDPRPHHLAWDGLVLPIDHPFWVTHGPPNGWGCSCYVVGARALDAAYRRGGKPDVQLPPDWNAPDPRTGAPKGIDKGWAYTPGQSVAQTLVSLTPKLATLPAPIGGAWVAEWPDTLFRAWSGAFGEFVDKALTTQPQQRSFVIGALKPAWIEKARDAGVAPAVADITATDVAIRHAFRATKPNQVPIDWYKRLPEWLRSPDVVLLDPDAKLPTLYLVMRVPGGNNQVVVKLQYKTKRLGEANVVITTQSGDDANIKTMMGRGYLLVEGKL